MMNTTMENSTATTNDVLYIIPAEDERRRDLNWPEHLQAFRAEYPDGCITKHPLGISKGRAVMQVQIYLQQGDTRPAAEAISCCYATGELSPYIQMAQDDALSQAFFELGIIKDGQAKSRKRRSKSVQQPVEGSKQESADSDEETPSPQNQITITDKAEAPAQTDDSERKILPMPTESKGSTEPEPPKISGDMSVDEIYAQITVEEAEKVQIPTGNYKGKMLGEITEQVPGMLAYYITLSGTGDNLFYAAVKKLYEAQEQQKKLAS